MKGILIAGNIILFAGAFGSFSGLPTPVCLLLIAIGASCFGFVCWGAKGDAMTARKARVSRPVDGLVRCSCWRKCDHTECGHKTPHKRFRKSKWGDCPRNFCGHVGHYVTCTPNAHLSGGVAVRLK